MDQQLARIDSRLDRMDGRLGRVEGRVDAIAADVGVIKTDVGVLKTDVGGLKAGMTRLESRLEEVDRHMRILFEELIDRIKATGQDQGIRLEVRRAVAVKSDLAEHATLDADANHYFANSVKEHALRLTGLESRGKP